MRWALCALAASVSLSLASPRSAARADEPPLVSIEPRLAGGLEMGGGSGASSWRLSAITAGVLAETAIAEEPWTSVYGEALVEGGQRAGVGGGAGVRVRPGDGALRVSGGGTAFIAPYTLLGATASVGVEVPLGGPRVSFDIQASAFFAGNDLPSGGVLGEIELVVGVPIHVF